MALTVAQKKAAKEAEQQAAMDRQEILDAAAAEDKASFVSDITDILGENVDLWFKRRIRMPDLVGKWLKFTSMEYRARDEGGYYILHFENKDGQQATSTTSSPKIKAKAAALINRGLWPVTGTIVPDGKGYDIVKVVE